MKNSYFAKMKKEGAAYQRMLEKEGSCISEAPLFSKGQSAAYRAWSISQNYEQDEITIDALPCSENLEDFINTFRKARIESIVLTGRAVEDIDKLTEHGCMPGEERTVKGLYDPRCVIKTPEIIYIKGRKVYL